VCVCFFILSSIWNIELWLNYNLLIIASKTKFVDQFSVTRSLKLLYVSCRLTMIYDFLPIVQLEQDNLNSKTYLSSIKVQVMESLRSIQHAPGVQMQEVSSLCSVVEYIHWHLHDETSQVKMVMYKNMGSIRTLKCAFSLFFFASIKAFYSGGVINKSFAGSSWFLYPGFWRRWIGSWWTCWP